MKNNKILYGLIFVVSLIVTNTIVFVTTKEFTVAKWINIAFLNLAIIILLVFSIMSDKKEYSFISYFRLPIVATYSIVTFILSALFIAFNLKNVAITIVVQILCLGLFVIIMSLNTMSNNVAKENMKTNKNNYNKISDMSKKIEIILETVKDRDIYKKIEKAYDDIKNARVNVQSDTAEIDDEIWQSIEMIENDIRNNDTNKIDDQVTKIHNLTIQRNRM